MYINIVVLYLKSCNVNIFVRFVCLFIKVFVFISEIYVYNFFYFEIF